ncbi:MAG: glycosyltransferase family 4 protein [Eubacterium sp.]|nr:glycosyltransferase family 4 protein [Eubacterium sp.]
MKVLFLTNIPSPYRMDFFNELGKYCDLDVVFERAASLERDKSWDTYTFQTFKGTILRGMNVGVDKAVSFDVFSYLNAEYDYIVIGNAATPTGIAAILYLKARRKKYYLEGDGGIYHAGNIIKEHVKKMILRNAAGYFSSSKELDKYYYRYGADKEKVYRYPFTSLFESDIVRSIDIEEGKRREKKRLGIEPLQMVLAVGRFIPVKGFDQLIKAAKQFEEQAVVYIIGGTETEEYSEIIKNYKIKNVKLLEFMQKEELFAYYQAADVFVFPSRGDAWGLVINEAMAFGIPVVTTKSCVAGLELIENGVNGYVVPVDDVLELSKKIRMILCDVSLKKSMIQNNLKKIQNYTIEKMVIEHIKVFEGLKNGEIK